MDSCTTRKLFQLLTYCVLEDSFSVGAVCQSLTCLVFREEGWGVDRKLCVIMFGDINLGIGSDVHNIPMKPTESPSF